MTHIRGHFPSGSLIIQDTLDKSGALIKSPITYHVHGYLYPSVDDETPDTKLKIIFQNNNQIQLPPPTTSPIWKDRRVGFHLMWVEIAGAGNKKLGIAYDLVDWEDHVNTETCLQTIHRFKGKKVEQIDPAVLEDLADRLEKRWGGKTTPTQDPESEKLIGIFKKGKWKSKSKNGEKIEGEQLGITIIKQSARFLRSPFFDPKNDPSYSWIKSNIKSFDLADGFFGNH